MQQEKHLIVNWKRRESWEKREKDKGLLIIADSQVFDGKKIC